MSHVEVPMERLAFFQTRLDLGEQEFASLERYREVFLAHRDEFADSMHAFLTAIPETRRIVELMEPRGGLRRNWRCWYEGLFTQRFDASFYAYLWNSGLKHLERNVDQRFIHLGYCMARLFLGDIVEREVPGEEGHRARAAVDKMMDLCLLVATDALLSGTTQCDREVINGIAHQVRNPLMVIGGFIQNLRKKTPADNPVQGVLSTMLEETRRLEAMVDDVGAYIEIMQKAPEFAPCSLEAILAVALRRLREEGWAVEPELRLDEAAGLALSSDPRLLETLFYELLLNSLEALRTAREPVLRVTARAEGLPPNALTVEVFNSGTPPPAEELEHLFTPFYSSKPTGSGFGLPIAALVVRKINAEIDIRAVDGEGTRTTVTLPLSVPSAN
ncbi:MAG: hypothetical protein HGA98_01015 [Deltaproteobacteria bacterium]|nr:hypothetical protein [Deltaproteobacteria bacterium]